MSLIDWRTLVPVIEEHSKDECLAAVEENFFNRRVILEQGIETTFTIGKNKLSTLTGKGIWNRVAWFERCGLNETNIEKEAVMRKYLLFQNFRKNEQLLKQIPHKTRFKVSDIYETISEYKTAFPKAKKNKSDT